MNKSSDSYKVYLQKEEAKMSGVLETQKEVGGQSYPGRALPPTQAVKDAVEKSGVTKQCVKDQVGDNRLPLNSHVKETKQFGPNN
jgi:hypothetical protein